MLQAVSPHCACSVQPTQAFESVSQTGEVPLHASALSAVHSTQTPPSQTGLAASAAAQAESPPAPEQSTHDPPWQKGVAASQAWSTSPSGAVHSGGSPVVVLVLGFPVVEPLEPVVSGTPVVLVGAVVLVG